MSNMDTDTVNSDEQAVPTVIAKKRELVDGDQPLTVEEQNAAEIARLTAWATGDCGKPILAD